MARNPKVFVVAQPTRGLDIGSYGYVALPLGFVAGAAGGLVWATLPAWLKRHGGIDEVVTTLLLNPVALLLAQAIAQARTGRAEGGIPIGAVLVHDGKVLGQRSQSTDAAGQRNPARQDRLPREHRAAARIDLRRRDDVHDVVPV